MENHKETVLTGLINAGRSMLERFDRSRITKEQPIRPCRRMRAAIEAAEVHLRKESVTMDKFVLVRAEHLRTIIDALRYKARAEAKPKLFFAEDTFEFLLAAELEMKLGVITQPQTSALPQKHFITAD